MNRRGFLTGLFTILPAAMSYERVWKSLNKVNGLTLADVQKIDKELRTGLNPAWANAEYEFAFIMNTDAMKAITPVLYDRAFPLDKEMSVNHIKESYPIRAYKNVDGQFVTVTPFIEV